MWTQTFGEVPTPRYFQGQERYYQKHGDELWDAICRDFGDGRWFVPNEVVTALIGKVDALPEYYTRQTARVRVWLILSVAMKTMDPDIPCMETDHIRDEAGRPINGRARRFRFVPPAH